MVCPRPLFKRTGSSSRKLLGKYCDFQGFAWPEAIGEFDYKVPLPSCYAGIALYTAMHQAGNSDL